MKKKQLETIVLIVGVLVIGIGLFLMLTRSNNPGNVFATNIVFSVGFLFYILYSIMSTNNLQAEIRSLQNHVGALKEDIKSKDESIEKQKKDIAKGKKDLNAAKKANSALEEELNALKLKLEEESKPGKE